MTTLASPTSSLSGIARSKRWVLLFSPILLVGLGYLTARFTGEIWGVWSWVPIILYYWGSLTALISWGGGTGAVRRWLQPSRSGRWMWAWRGLLMDATSGWPGWLAGLYSAFWFGASHPLILGAGIAAANISLVQAGMQQVLANPDILAAGDSPLRMMLALINVTDTFKLLALALFNGSASMLAFQSRALPKWLGWLGVALTLTLVLGGLSFMISSSILTTFLFVSLPLLLLWVVSISVTSLCRTAILSRSSSYA